MRRCLPLGILIVSLNIKYSLLIDNIFLIGKLKNVNEILIRKIKRISQVQSQIKNRLVFIRNKQ